MKKEDFQKLDFKDLKILETIKELGGKCQLKDISNLSKINIHEVSARIEKLNKMGFLREIKVKKKVIRINKKKIKEVEKELPERKLCEILKQKNGKLPIEKIVEICKDEGIEYNVAIGWAKRKGKIDIIDDELGAKYVILKDETTSLDEKIFNVMAGTNREIAINGINSNLINAIIQLRKRGIILIKENIEKRITITDKGKELLREIKRNIDNIENKISALTEEILMSETWKKAIFKKYEISTTYRPLYLGKKHLYVKFIDEIKNLLTSLGFYEIYSPIIETFFWDFEALLYPESILIDKLKETYIIMRKSDSTSEYYTKKLRKKISEIIEVYEKFWSFKCNIENLNILSLKTDPISTLIKYLIEFNENCKIFCISKIIEKKIKKGKPLEKFYLGLLYVEDDVSLIDLITLAKMILSKFNFKIIDLVKAYMPYASPCLEILGENENHQAIKEIYCGLLRPEISRIIKPDSSIGFIKINLNLMALRYFNLESENDLFITDLNKIREETLWLKF